jgi:hypothetical protein
MKTLRILFPLLVCLALPFAAGAQSLGSVAKKERERRDKNKKEGVSAREIKEEEVFGDKDEETPPEEAVPEEAESGASLPEEEPSIPGVKSTAPGADPDREGRERKRNEAEWRSKASAARARIEKARERVRFFEELFLGPNERYVDANGNTVIDSVEDLQRLTREAKSELAEAEAAWKRMQEDARRAGIPPGWLR